MAIDLVARLSLDDQMSGPLAALNGKLMGMVGFAAVTAGATSAVKTFADFDTAIRKAATIAGASDSEFVAMGEAAKELGASTSLSASQVAEAMTEMAAKGYDATQVIDAMPGVIAAAEASGEDLAMTSDVVATALNVWGMEASEASDVADVLAMTANKTAAGIGDMQYALKYAGAPAKALGMSLEEVSAAAGLMVNAGLDGSSAGTAMRQGLSQLVNPTKAAATAMDKYGFSAIDANGKVKSMADIVGNLQSSMEGMTEAQRVSYMKTLVGTESMSAFLTLVDAGPEKLTELQKELENSGGSAQEAADKMKAGIGGALEQASGAIETFMINVGEALAPAVRVFADMIANMNTEGAVAKIGELGDQLTGFAEKLVATDWSPFVSAISTAFNAVIAVATFVVDHFTLVITAVKVLLAAFMALKAISFVVGVFNTVVSAINMMITVVNTAKKVWDVLKTTFLIVRGIMMMFPGTWIVTAVMAVIAIGIALIKNWDSIKQKALDLWENIKSGNSAFSFLQPVIQAAIDAFNWLKDTLGTVKDYLVETWQRILEGQSSVHLLLGPLGLLIQAGVLLYQNWGTIKDAAIQLWENLKSGETSFASLLGPIGLIIDAGMSLYRNWDTVKAGAAALWAKVQAGQGAFFILKAAIAIVKVALTAIIGVFKLVVAAVTAVWHVFNNQGPAQLMRNGLNNVKEVASKVKGAFDAMKDGISRAMQNARIAVTDSINSIIGQINNLINMINKIPGVNVPLIATVEYRATGSVDNQTASVKNSGSAGTNSVNGPHALGNHGGWNEIRSDGTLRNLHAGERVLTAVENKGYKELMSSGLPGAIAKLATSRNNNGGGTDIMPVVAAIKSLSPRTLDNMQGTNVTQPQPITFGKMTFDAVITAINKVAKRPIELPKDNRMNSALESLSDTLSLNLSDSETQALASTTENSSFSETVSNINTTNTIARTSSVDTSKRVDVGNITVNATVREEADATKIADVIASEILARV